LADDDHVILAPQQIADAPTNQFVIVQQEDSYRHVTMVPDLAGPGGAMAARPICVAAGRVLRSQASLTLELGLDRPVCNLMVPAAIPFAVAAAFFPPAVAVMLWLFATPPRVRRGVIYLAGAATSTIGSGLIIMGLLHGVQTAPGRRTTIESTVEVVLGAVFVLFAVGLALRRPRLARPDRGRPPTRLRARGYAGIFLLGVVMWIPSFAYVAAIDLIVDSGLALPAQVLNLLIVAIIILAPVEAPLLLYGLAPRAVISTVSKVDALVRRYFWQLGSISAGAGGIYLLLRGSLQLSD
jgi:hypothetical protein